MDKRNGLWCVFRIAVGITMLGLLLAGDAGAVTLTVDDKGGANLVSQTDIDNASRLNNISGTEGTFHTAGYGVPELKVTAKDINPSKIKPENKAILNLTVSEVIGADWAKDVTVYVEILNPNGTNFSETGTYIASHYLGRIERFGNAKTNFEVNVSNSASFGNRTIKITIQYYETGGFDLFTYGPYYSYSNIDFTVLNSQENVEDEGVTTIPYMTYLILHDPNGDGSYSFIEKNQQFTIGSEFELRSSNMIRIEANLNLFGQGAGYSDQVTLNNTTSGGVEMNFKTTDLIETSKTGIAGVIGPGYGDVFYGEQWDIHYKFINRSTWLGYDGIYSTTVGGKNNIIVGYSAGVVRDLPSSALPNTVIRVNLNVTMGSSVYYSIDEQVPAGWRIVSASNGGDYTSMPGHVKWTVENYASDTILTYNISIPSNNISGIYNFLGSYRFGGPFLNSIVGDDRITVDEIIPLIATREISKHQAVLGSSFTVKVLINTSKDSSEVKNLNLLEIFPQGWNITNWSVPPSFISNGMALWEWPNTNSGDSKILIYNVTIPISATETVQAISGTIGAEIRTGRYKLIEFDRVYQYYIVRSSEFMKPGYWIDQNVEEPWRSQMLGLDIGFDNFIDNNESKKVEKDKNLKYTATDSPVSHKNSTTISSSNKLTFTMEVNKTTAINWDLDIIGIPFGGKVITASSLYLGHTNYTKNLQNVVSGYTINDDDALPFGDSINTTIYYDKVFGTYLFITDTNTSNTVNPREPWTKSPLNITPTKGETGGDFKFISKMRKDLNKAEVRIQQPDQIDIVTLQLFDDGMHGDGVSGDGIYGNIWNSAGAYGEYYVDVISWDRLNQRGEADNVGTFNVFDKPVDLLPVAYCGPDKLQCENVGTKVQFNGTASYDTDGTIISYAWEFGDGGIGAGEAPNHTYATYRWNGSAYQPFMVNLTVEDDSGLTNRTSQNVTIWIAGDANGDGKVNILDASVVGLKWNGNDACADLNNDEKVNILDASIIGLNWGKIA